MEEKIENSKKKKSAIEELWAEDAEFESGKQD